MFLMPLISRIAIPLMTLGLIFVFIRGGFRMSWIMGVLSVIVVCLLGWAAYFFLWEVLKNA